METDLLGIMRSRLAEAESDAQKLRDAIAVIEGSNGDAHAPRRRRQAKKKEPAPAQEPKKVIPLGKLLSSLKSEPGQSASRLSTESGGDQKAILALLKEAEQVGSVRREGERRATVWFAVTAEDKAEAEVADKAAEIQARTMKAPRKRPAHKPVTRKPKDETPMNKPGEDAPAPKPTPIPADAGAASEATATD